MLGTLNRDAIAALIPHQGAMCLLSTVERYDERTIVCRATSVTSVSRGFSPPRINSLTLLKMTTGMSARTGAGAGGGETAAVLGAAFFADVSATAFVRGAATGNVTPAAAGSIAEGEEDGAAAD